MSMGLFTKDKNAELAPPNAPPAPQAPGINEAPAPEMPAPPAPNMPAAVPELNSNAEGMSDIKNQISMPAPPTLTEEFVKEDEANNNIPTKEVESSDLSMENDSDSLFDLSDLELPDSNPTLEQTSSPEESQEYKKAEESKDALHFIESKKEKVDESKPFFVTTAQFKSILEIIENVKAKTKESSQRHLRLLDIKSEEDIEYENLKKDFVYIEDKLYEVDNLLFEE